MASSDSTTGIERLIRPELITIAGYVPGTSPKTLEGKVEVPVESFIKLNSNENPYGCSPRVQPALAACRYLHTYPDTKQTELRRQLQEYIGIDTECIVAFNGSDELIDYTLRLFIEPGDEVINCVPSYDMFRFSPEMCNGKLVEVPRDENFAINVDAVKAAISKKTKMILLANPNNPTGTIIPQKDILEIIDTGVPVLVDEAYYEFCGETVAPFTSRYQNLIVSRTFSKWAGLAGLRVGYGIFPPAIAKHLLKIKPPFNINAAALVAVEESLKDVDYLLDKVKVIIAERERLFIELQKLKFLKPFSSQTNFILCSVVDGKASEIQQELQNRGILIRYFDLPLLRNSIRISVGKPEHTDALIKALQEIGEEIVC